MPLRRLELYNFKSYKGQQIIDLGDAPFMCIIGPNGAGKSNLMDAISFVLGVKSAQLRSTQLRDLIYRGRTALDIEEEETQAQDATDAHVVAVYEDDSGKEWKFKRRISLTGQSTYLLNNRETSYKAYNAQLERFNVLVKAKNFLVFQGDVESVASQDSRELAKLVDRISGSADLAHDYELAKTQLEKAAEASNMGYAKKRSMLSEVKHFKEQEEEVKMWEKLNRNKETTIQRHLLWKLYHITAEINEHTQRIGVATANLEGLRDSAAEQETKLKEAKKDAAAALLAVKKRENAMHRAEKAHEDKKPDLVSVETQIAHAERKMIETEKLIVRVEKDLERQTDDLSELEEGAQDVEERMRAAAEKQRQKSAASGRALSKADLEEYRRLRAAANSSHVAERQQVETLRRENKVQRDALHSTDDKIQQAEAQKARLNVEMDRLSTEDLEHRQKELLDERERIKAQLDQAQTERERISIKETELNEKLQDVFGKLQSAGAEKRESERESRLREVLANLKRIFPGVHGRVIDLCKPTSRKYETAVTTILGRNIDAIVVDQEKVAIDCIEYMRNQRAGQATFIPLDTIQVGPVQEKYRNFTKGARLAIDCLEYEAAIERALQHACGSSLICDTMTVAKYVCYERNQEVKAVTLDGTVIHKSGLITGGTGSSQRRFNDTDVQSLHNAKDTYMKQLAELAKARPTVDDHLLTALRRLDAEISVLTDNLDAANLRSTGISKEIASLQKEVGKLQADRVKKSRAVEATEGKLSDIERILNTADDGVFDQFCRKIRVESIRDYEDVQLRMSREEDEAMAKHTAQQARIQHQITFASSQKRDTEDRLRSLKTKVDRIKSSIVDLSKAKDDVNADLVELQNEIDRQQKRLEATQKEYDDYVAHVDNSREETRKAQRALDKALKEIASWNDEIVKAASSRHAVYRRCRLEEIDLPLISGRLDKVPIEEDPDALEIDDDEAVGVEDWGVEPDFEILDDEEKEDGSDEVGQRFEAQIGRIKVELEKMVPNMKAVERLADVQAGLNEADAEADEARQESKAAKDRFQDLKKKRCDLFNKAYSHMSNCIDKVYKDLTKSKTFQTGGVAFLSLEDAEEPYLSGIKYNVMPPGKAFVDMEQLSGGEKTMAALALLFAIHSFHPAPFFVLDEVDAALDPTNVAKLARYVRKQAEQAVQFLIISLKATLYEHADGLVGVYREQEENTSKVLSLDLRQYAE